MELGVVIGRTARYVSREKALDYVWGYTIINDVSARDFQFITQPVDGRARSPRRSRRSVPTSPTAARFRIPTSLSLKTFVNGKQMQNGNTKTFIFDVSYLVSYLSNLMTLLAGRSDRDGDAAGRRPRR